jgi:hypothetical protein
MNIVFANSAWYGCVVTTRTVDDVDVALLEARGHLAAQPLEVLLGELVVDVAPPDAVLGLRLAYDELVLRRAAGEAAGVDDERPTLGQHGFLPLERVHVEQRRGRVAEHAAGRIDAVV